MASEKFNANLYDIFDQFIIDKPIATIALVTFTFIAFMFSALSLFTSIMFMQEELNRKLHYLFQGIILVSNCLVLIFYHESALSVTRDGCIYPGWCFTPYYVAPVFICISLGYTFIGMCVMVLKYKY